MAKTEIDFSPTNPENAEAGALPEKEVEDPGELSVDVGPEVEKKPDVVTLTPEEFAALKASSDTARATREGIESLATKLGQQQAPRPMPVNAPTQTAEEFFAEHSDEIFDKEKGAAVLKKFTKMASEQEYGGMLRGMSSALANTRKELLEAKDSNYKKYKGEVEALVASQTPEMQIAPDIYERAWASVRANHAEEIEDEKVNDKVAKAVEEALKAHGIDPSKPAGRPPAHVQSQGRSAPTISTEQNSGRRVRLPDAATEQKLRAEALRKGLDFEDLLKIRGLIK